LWGGVQTRKSDGKVGWIGKRPRQKDRTSGDRVKRELGHFLAKGGENYSEETGGREKRRKLDANVERGSRGGG